MGWVQGSGKRSVLLHEVHVGSIQRVHLGAE